MTPCAVAEHDGTDGATEWHPTIAAGEHPMADKDRKRKKGGKAKDKDTRGKRRKDEGHRPAAKGKHADATRGKKARKNKDTKRSQIGLNMLETLTGVIASDDKKANETGRSLLSAMTKTVAGDDRDQNRRGMRMLDTLTKSISSADMWQRKENSWKSTASDTFRARLQHMHRMGRYPHIRIHDGQDVVVYGDRSELALRDYGNAIVSATVVRDRLDGTVEMMCFIGDTERGTDDRIVQRARRRRRSI